MGPTFFGVTLGTTGLARGIGDARVFEASKDSWRLAAFVGVIMLTARPLLFLNGLPGIVFSQHARD
jgi:hypothetical protein